MFFDRSKFVKRGRSSAEGGLRAGRCSQLAAARPPPARSLSAGWAATGNQAALPAVESRPSRPARPRVVSPQAPAGRFHVGPIPAGSVGIRPAAQATAGRPGFRHLLPYPPFYSAFLPTSPPPAPSSSLCPFPSDSPLALLSPPLLAGPGSNSAAVRTKRLALRPPVAKPPSLVKSLANRRSHHESDPLRRQDKRHIRCARHRSNRGSNRGPERAGQAPLVQPLAKNSTGQESTGQESTGQEPLVDPLGAGEPGADGKPRLVIVRSMKLDYWLNHR